MHKMTTCTSFRHQKTKFKVTIPIPHQGVQVIVPSVETKIIVRSNQVIGPTVVATVSGTSTTTIVADVTIRATCPTRSIISKPTTKVMKTATKTAHALHALFASVHHAQASTWAVLIIWTITTSATTPSIMATVHPGASVGAVGGAGAVGMAGVPTTAVGTAGGGVAGTTPGTTLGMVAQVGAGEVGMAVGPHGVPLTSMVATGTWVIRIVPLSMQTIVPQPAMALADVAATSVSLTIDPPSVAHLMGRTTALL